jgi:hypothetical protein
MSQHIYSTTLEGKPVKLTIGWDRPLKQYFYNLMDLTPGTEEPVIGTSMTMDSAVLDNLDPILEELKRLGITPPEKMVEEVQADEINRAGNRIENY